MTSWGCPFQLSLPPDLTPVRTIQLCVSIVTHGGPAIIHYSPDPNDCAMITNYHVRMTGLAGPFY